MYTAGKALYLKQHGWKVFIFFYGNNQGQSIVSALTEYIPIGGGCNFLFLPPYKYKVYEQEQFLNSMVNRLGAIDPDNCEIILESHYGAAAYWAELLASKINGRHFFVMCDEEYRPVHAEYKKADFMRVYVDNLDYFHFKWQRNEIVGSSDGIKKLFAGYKNTTKLLIDMPPVIAEMYPIQDVPFPAIDNIVRLDWNICHFGRASKEYVQYVIEGIGELARRHPDKTINFIAIGNIAERMELIKKTFGNTGNVRLTVCGNMVPVPSSLFKKVDVVCAISQSARFTANEGLLTVVGTADHDSINKTPGVLGYDTDQQVCGEGIYSYCEALERVLVKKIYNGKKYKLPKLRPAEKYYDDFFAKVVKSAAPTKEYYVDRLKNPRIRDWTAIFPFGMVARETRVVLFGATDIAKDYRSQIDSQSNIQTEIGLRYVKRLEPQPYCQVIATVDENPGEFDDSVTGIERLQQRDYDAIVITTLPTEYQAAYNKIVQLVPEMKDRIIYNFQIIRT